MSSSITLLSRDMDPMIEQIVSSMGIDTHGSFNRATERKSIISNLKPFPSESNNVYVSVNSPDDSRISGSADANDNCNVEAILGGDREFHFSKGSYFGSGSLDGAVSGFWALVWNSLTISWSLKILHYSIDWPYRAVYRKARLLRRQSKGSARPYVNIEGYPKHAALPLVKDTFKL